MTTTDDAVRLQVMIERSKGTLARSALKMITALDRAAVDAIPGRDLHTYRMPAVTRLLSMADQKLYHESMTLFAEYADAIELFAKELILVEAAAWDGLHTEDMLRAALDAPLGIDGRECGNTILQMMQHWWADARSSVFGAIRRAAYENERNSSIIDRIHGTRGAKFKDGFIDYLRRNTMTMNQTLVHHVATSVRNEVLRTTSAKGVFFSAIFERSTCARCRGLDYTTFSLDRGPRSPLHYGCRCIMVPIMSNNDMKSESYYEWLSRQDEDFIRVAIGPQRARLLLSGGLPPDEFARLQLDKRFEPITLEEFRRIAPSVFKRAGV